MEQVRKTKRLSNKSDSKEEVRIGRAQEFHVDVDLRRLAESCSRLGDPFAQFVKRLRSEVARIRDGSQHDVPQIPLFVKEVAPYVMWKALFTACLPKYPYLRKVQLHHCEFGDDGVLLLTSFIKNYKPAVERNSSGIDFLELPNCKIGIRGATALGKLFTENTTVKRLVLDFNNFGDEGVSNLCEGVQWNSTLKELSMEYCSITSLGASSIALTVMRTSGVEKLSLCGNTIGDNGLCEVGLALSCNDKLLELDLSDNGFGESPHASEVFSEAIEINKCLQTLKLNENILCEKSAHFICNAITCNRILTEVILDERINTELNKTVLDAIASNRKENKDKKKKVKKKVKVEVISD